MHALHTPVAGGGRGQTLDIERRRGNEEALLDGASLLQFGAVDDAQDGSDALEFWLSRIAAVGCDPVDATGGLIEAGLDAAMALFDGLFGDQLTLRCGAEIGCNVGLERRLIALHGEQEIGLVGDDPISNIDLATHGVDGDERAFKLAGVGEMVEEVGDRGDLIGLFRHAQLRQRQAGIGGMGTERMQRL